MARTVSITISANDSFSAVFQKYGASLNEAVSQNQQLNVSTGGASGAIDELGTAVKGAIVAYAGMKGIQLVGDMLDIGQKVNVASQTFDALTSKIGGSSANMRALQIATGNTVTDFNLLVGANRLLQMGLATNSDELGRLSGMAVKLGSSMGMDATKSMSDFSLMLANNSIMRLDQFGISSGRVRQRMQELQQTMEGIDKNEAFKLAVLEEGQAALDRLGAAADANSTPILRLVTSVQNLVNVFNTDLNTGANSVIGILEILTGNNPIQKKQEADKAQAQAQAQAVAEVYAQRYHEALGSEYQALGTADLLFQNSLAVANQNPQMSSGDAVAQAYSAFTYNDTVGVSDEELQKMQQVTYAMLEQKKAAEDIARSQQESASIIQQQKQLYQDYLATGGGDDRQASLADQRAGRDYAASSQLEAATGSDLAKGGSSAGKTKPSEITSAMKTDLAAIAKDSGLAGDNIAKMVESISKGATHSKQIKEALDHIRAVVPIMFKFTADDPQGVLALIKQLGGGVGLGEIVRNSGGRVPGATAGGSMASATAD